MARPNPIHLVLEEATYVRERADPRPGDGFYLHLVDLVSALRNYSSTDSLRILDFGCGGSPYQFLFPNATYQRADLPKTPNLDFEIGVDGRVNAPDTTFDLVLSTQVLEHCPDPSVYLAEARRILRPGGRIILTTHGVFEDHGCPYDFLRWTKDGLERELGKAGFEVQRCLKLTTGGRAIAFIFEHHGDWMKGGRNTPFGILIRLVRRALFIRPNWFHNWCDSNFKSNRVVEGHEPGHSMYVALLIVGVRAD